jgi:hypothetical protein
MSGRLVHKFRGRVVDKLMGRDLAQPWRAVCGMVASSAGRVPKDAPFRDDGGLFEDNERLSARGMVSVHRRDIAGSAEDHGGDGLRTRDIEPQGAATSGRFSQSPPCGFAHEAPHEAEDKSQAHTRRVADQQNSSGGASSHSPGVVLFMGVMRWNRGWTQMNADNSCNHRCTRIYTDHSKVVKRRRVRGGPL